MSFTRLKNRHHSRLDRRDTLKRFRQAEGVGKKIKNRRKKLFRIMGMDSNNGKTKRTRVKTKSGVSIIKQQLSRQGIIQARIKP